MSTPKLFWLDVVLPILLAGEDEGEDEDADEGDTFAIGKIIVNHWLCYGNAIAML